MESIPCSGAGCEAKVTINADAHDAVRGSGGAHERLFCPDCSAKTTAAIESLMAQLEGDALGDALQPSNATATAANAAAEATQLAPQSQEQPHRVEEPQRSTTSTSSTTTTEALATTPKPTAVKNFERASRSSMCGHGVTDDTGAQVRSLTGSRLNMKKCMEDYVRHSENMDTVQADEVLPSKTLCTKVNQDDKQCQGKTPCSTSSTHANRFLNQKNDACVGVNKKKPKDWVVTGAESPADQRELEMLMQTQFSLSTADANKRLDAGQPAIVAFNDNPTDMMRDTASVLTNDDMKRQHLPENEEVLQSTCGKEDSAPFRVSVSELVLWCRWRVPKRDNAPHASGLSTCTQSMGQIAQRMLPSSSSLAKSHCCALRWH